MDQAVYSPEEQPGLAELERLQVVLLHQRHTEDIRSREQPAPATAPLVRDRRALKGDLDVVDLLVGDLGLARGQDIAGVCGGEGGEGESISCLSVLIFPPRQLVKWTGWRWEGRPTCSWDPPATASASPPVC